MRNQIDAVHVGEPQIEHDQIGLLAGGQHQSLLTGFGFDATILVRRQRSAQEAANLLLVLDDQDFRAFGRHDT